MNKKYVVSKIDNKEYCFINGHFKRHLDNHNHTHQSYYEKYITGIEEKCSYCNKPKKFYHTSWTYADTCGSRKCSGKQISKIRSNFTCEQWEHSKKAYQTTMSQKTDEELAYFYKCRVESLRTNINDKGQTMMNQMVENIAKTKLERYGDSGYNNAKQISASKKLHTVEQINETNEKRRITMLEKYGVEHNFFRPEVRSKIAYGNSKKKDYTFPSGKTILTLGYEPKAIDVLLETYLESQINVGEFSVRRKQYGTAYNIPTFKYKDFKDYYRRYYPDIFIPSKNLIIEVKSQWWFDGYGKEKYESRLENNMRKRQSCIDSGYNFQFWIYNTDTKGFDII